MKILRTASYLLAASLLFATACNSGTEASSENDTSTTANKTDNPAQFPDSSNATTAATANPDQNAVDFLVPANSSEMAWLAAGINQGTDKEVKSHAKMMLADHKSLGEKVKALITKHNLTAPAVDTTGVVNITQSKGKEWDKAWADKMVTDHSELLSKLNEFETSVQNADLKALVTKTKPVVQAHLDMSKKMQEKMGKM